MIRVTVTATNSISSLNTTNQIRAIEQIRGIQSKVKNPVVNLDGDVVVIVKVIGGAYGDVTVVFNVDDGVDDNISVSKYFLHQLSENTSTLHFEHGYRAILSFKRSWDTNIICLTSSFQTKKARIHILYKLFLSDTFK